MHEVSIVMGMIDELTKIAQENNARKVVNVKLKIGAQSGVVTDSLKFVFDSVKLDYPLLSSAEILIEEIPSVYECTNCNKTFSPQDKSSGTFNASDLVFPSCPECRSFCLKLLSGEEMDIENLEVEV